MGLKSNIIIQNSDICCFKDYYFSKKTAAKIQTQGITIKDLYPKKPKSKEIKPAHFNTTKPLEQNKKNKKDRKKMFQEKMEQKNILPTGNNIINA